MFSVLVYVFFFFIVSVVKLSYVTSNEFLKASWASENTGEVKELTRSIVCPPPFKALEHVFK